MIQSVCPSTHSVVVVKKDPNVSPTRSPPQQQSQPDHRTRHHFVQANSYHPAEERVEYVDMHGNHLVPPHSAPLPQFVVKPAKYEPFAQAGAVEPPFRGYCENTHDALILFEAAKRGIIPRVTRRLTDREKAAMIKSGAVFVFDEHESNIKRWTDGMSWSPSRIFGNYLTYREIVDKAETLASAHAAGSTEDAPGLPQTTLTRPYPRNPLPGTTRNRPHLSAASVSGLELPANTNRPRSASDSQPQPFETGRNGKKGGQAAKNFWRPNGLVKRTISVLVNGYHQHLVSYYNPADVHEDRLYRPRDVPLLAKLEIGDEYLRSDSFRLPIQTALSMDGKLQYVGEPSSIPGQANNQQNQQEAFPVAPSMPAPPATAPMRQQTVYNISPQGYTFVSVPQEVMLDPTSHSRPSTGTSHGSVITPMSPVTNGNYYDNYLEQEQQKAMANTAPVTWQVPLPTPNQRPHTTQFGGGASMARQLSEGTGKDKISARVRSSSRYQPYGSPDQANFPQAAMQLVLPGHPARPTIMRRTPSYQNGQATYVPMTPVSETVTNSPTTANTVMMPAGVPYEIHQQKIQPSPTQTAISQESPQEMQQMSYGAGESSTPRYDQVSHSQVQLASSTPEGAMGIPNGHHMRSFSNHYTSLDDMAIASSLPIQGWATGLGHSGMSHQYMQAPGVKMELLSPASEPVEMTRSLSGPPTTVMNSYPPQMPMHVSNPNGEHSMPTSNNQWMIPIAQDPQSRHMVSPSYPHQPMLSMGPPQMVLSGWQTSMSPVYQDVQQPQPMQTIYYSQMPSQAQ